MHGHLEVSLDAPMHLIKRYPNRKLYDTLAKRYITLDDVAALVRDDQDIRVLDNESGDDLTEVTLAQVIFAETRQKAAQLPRTFLAQLIRAGDAPTHAWRRRLRAVAQALVEEGELTEHGARRLQGLWDMTATGEAGWTGIAERHLQAALQRLNLPSHDDVQQLRTQLDELARRLEDLASMPSAVGEGE